MRNKKTSKPRYKKEDQISIEDERAKIINDTTSFHVQEAYKATRTNIMFSLAGEGCKTILVASSFPQEGKSTTCVNMAITFAQTGARVLVLDCDLRKPTIHRKLDLPNELGLTHVISGFNTLADEGVIQQSKYENMHVITCGHVPPNPAELLASESMRQIMEELKKHYDYIFIDTPPIHMVTDATVLVPYTSGVAIVARQDHTHHRDLQESIEKLSFSKAKILGIIFAGVKQGKGGYGKYSKYGKYGSYEYKSNGVSATV